MTGLPLLICCLIQLSLFRLPICMANADVFGEDNQMKINGAYISLLIFMTLLLGCADFRPMLIEETSVLQRAQSQTQGDIQVTVAVPTLTESRQLFDTDLHGKHVLPVWISIQNNSDYPVWFHPYTIDPNYFSFHEVAWLSHRTGAMETNERIDDYFRNHAMSYFVPSRKIASGFVFVNKKPGTMYIPVRVIALDGQQTFEFFVKDPGLRTDYDRVDFNSLYPADTVVDLEDVDAVRRWTEKLPCCTTNKKSTLNGDPINIIVIASDLAFKRGFLRVGWDEAAALSVKSAAKTAVAGLSGQAYENAPFSSLYLFNRPQDVGLQKARQNIHQRNHLRLWLAPVTFKGTSVWVGQISRDIGSRLTSKTVTFTTHKIDPNVDDARDGLLLDFYAAQVIDSYGFVKGVGEATPDAPRENLTGDPYYTDGLRAVVFLLKGPMPTKPVRYLNRDAPDRQRLFFPLNDN